MSMPFSETLRKELEAEDRAYEDYFERVARDDPDWGFYLDPADKPRLPWWRRLLKL